MELDEMNSLGERLVAEGIDEGEDRIMELLRIVQSLLREGHSLDEAFAEVKAKVNLSKKNWFKFKKTLSELLAVYSLSQQKPGTL